MDIKFKKLNPDAKMPTYGSSGAACFDLYPTESGTVWYGRPLVVGTGISVEVPPGYGLFVFSRSGQGFKHNVRLANSTGIIDSDYRGEIKVKLTCDDGPAMPYSVTPDQAVAQAVILPCPQVRFVEAEELNSTERGAGGFGSTDKPKVMMVTLEERQRMESRLSFVREHLGTPAAQQIIKDVGGVAKMTDVPDDLVKKVAAAAELRAHMENIVSEAQKFGLVLTVSQVAKQPLAMGNYNTEVSIRAARATGERHE